MPDKSWDLPNILTVLVYCSSSNSVKEWNEKVESDRVFRATDSLNWLSIIKTILLKK